jgi:Tol biopolymer transport system component
MRSLAFVLAIVCAGAPATGAEVLLLNRLGPSASVLYISAADGSAERRLFSSSGFDCNASFSTDATWIVFTSERDGPGQSEIYRVHPDGTGLERLTDHAAMDDQAALSPDGTQLAFVSTRDTHKANIWILDLATRQLRNLTGAPGIQGAPDKPGGSFRPAWSPDGAWIAFSSDRNTEWKGHRNGAGWEHVQELGVYVIQPNGQGLRRVSQPGVSAGSPKWSPDGTRLVFYEIPVESTFAARMPFSATVSSQIVSVDVATGTRTEHTSGPGLKLTPQFATRDRIGYLIKAGPKEGLAYVDSAIEVPGRMRAPSWSRDGSLVVYERQDFTSRPQNQRLYAWDRAYEYRYTDVFPSFSKDGTLAVTDFDSKLSNPTASISVMAADGSQKRRVFANGAGAAYSPSWSPDGQWLVFGFGGFLNTRDSRPGKIVRVRVDGSRAEDLTEGPPNAGFPSWSPDGKRIVYRVWGQEQHGLRILDLSDRSIKVLTTDYDNVPFWAPHDDRILFTRRHNGDFELFTIRSDGSDLRQITTSPGNDAHGVWTDDGQYVMWSSARYGFKDEAALYDNCPQPYAAIFIMKPDGTELRQLTDSRWEDAMPRFVPKPASPTPRTSSR